MSLRHPPPVKRLNARAILSRAQSALEGRELAMRGPPFQASPLLQQLTFFSNVGHCKCNLLCLNMPNVNDYLMKTASEGAPHLIICVAMHPSKMLRSLWGRKKIDCYLQCRSKKWDTKILVNFNRFPRLPAMKHENEPYINQKLTFQKFK